jgi:hypothetical protein
LAISPATLGRANFHHVGNSTAAHFVTGQQVAANGFAEQGVPKVMPPSGAGRRSNRRARRSRSACCTS